MSLAGPEAIGVGEVTSMVSLPPPPRSPHSTSVSGGQAVGSTLRGSATTPSWLALLLRGALGVLSQPEPKGKGGG